MADTLAALIAAHFPEYITGTCLCGADVPDVNDWSAHVADVIRQSRGGATAHAGGGALPGSVGCVLASWDGADWRVASQTGTPAQAERAAIDAAVAMREQTGAQVKAFAMYELAEGGDHA